MLRKKINKADKFKSHHDSDDTIELDELDGTFEDIDLGDSGESPEDQEKKSHSKCESLHNKLSLFRERFSRKTYTVELHLNPASDLLTNYLMGEYNISIYIKVLALKEFDYFVQTPEEDEIAEQVKRFFRDANPADARYENLKKEYSELLTALEDKGLSAAVRALAFRAFHQKWIGEIAPRHVNTP